MSDATIQKPNVWKKRLIMLISVVALWFVWKADVFWNYYQFKQLCAAEGGLKVYEKLEKGRGWELTWPSADEQNARFYISRMSNIGFFRVPKANDFPPPAIAPDTLVDVRYLGGPTLPISSYSFQLADQAMPIKYQIATDVNRENSEHVSRYSFEVKDKETKKVFIRNDQFRYNWRTIPVWHWFGPKGQTGCPLPGYGSEDVESINKTAFKD